MGKITKIELSESERIKLNLGFKEGSSHCFRMRCKAVLLKSEGLSSEAIGKIVEMNLCQQLGQTLPARRYFRAGNPKRARTKTDYGLFRRGGCPQGNRKWPPECEQGAWSLAECCWQGSQRIDFQAFFISIGARYKRIRKRPRGCPSPQLYEYKKEKLQELENLDSAGEIDLYYADESHVCTSGYVPYGWQFKDEDVFIPSEKSARLNIFGMITRGNQYKGFMTQESINADKVSDFLDKMSLQVRKRTFVVLDNATVHRNAKLKELRSIWESRGLFLFFLPPYSPELNLAETLWRILKGKWIRPMDYVSNDTLFYSANRALAAVGISLFVNYSKCA